MAMHPDSSSQSSPHKRIKTLIPPPQSPPSSISKGKSKIQEGTSVPTQNEVEDESTDCCGICLVEAGDGGVSRGYIDSCNHYFCFVCIMEWAKVESKCPLCKRRFSTIRRPPKPPIFTSERVVHVPVRDQVYHYFGNATIGPPDLYAEAKCSICQGVADESLLLLCDLCDSASHTYCVGLGVTVPEGDWFCQDCTLLRGEHLKSETNTDSGFESSVASADKHVSVFDIVQHPCGHAVQRSRRSSTDPCHLPPPSSTDDKTSMIQNFGRPSSRSLIVTGHSTKPTKPNTRTLQHCRNLHDRIRVLRENWNGFQIGNLCFSSSTGDGSISRQTSNTCISGRNSVSCLNQQSALCSSSGTTNDSSAHQIQRAWKMMDRAKSIKQGHERSSVVHQASKCPLRKVNTLKNGDYRSYRYLSSESQQNGSKNVGNIGRGHHHYNSAAKDYYKQPSSVSGKQKWRTHMTEDVTYCQGSITGHSPTQQELEYYKDIQTPSFMYNARVRSGEKLPAEKSFERPACLSSSVVSKPVVLNIDHVEVGTSSSRGRVRHTKEKSELKKTCVDSRQYNDARCEIQALVKLNLKLQTKEEKLEVDAFKEVARLATHSILAACGLEHPKASSCSIPGFVCSHANEVGQLQRSSLMPNSCRVCFYAFVKDVVNSVVLQKKRREYKT